MSSSMDLLSLSSDVAIKIWEYCRVHETEKLRECCVTLAQQIDESEFYWTYAFRRTFSKANFPLPSQFPLTILHDTMNVIPLKRLHSGRSRETKKRRRQRTDMSKVIFRDLMHYMDRRPAYLRPTRGEMIVGLPQRADDELDIIFESARGFTRFQYVGQIIGFDRAVRSNKPFRLRAPQLFVHRYQNEFRIGFQCGGYFEITIESPLSIEKTEQGGERECVAVGLATLRYPLSGMQPGSKVIMENIRGFILVKILRLG